MSLQILSMPTSSTPDDLMATICQRSLTREDAAAAAVARIKEKKKEVLSY